MKGICEECNTSRAVCVTCLCEMAEERKREGKETKLQAGLRLIDEYFNEEWNATPHIEVRLYSSGLRRSNEGLRMLESYETDNNPFMADEIAAEHGNPVVSHTMYLNWNREKEAPDIGASQFALGDYVTGECNVTIFYSAEKAREHLEFNEDVAAMDERRRRSEAQ